MLGLEYETNTKELVRFELPTSAFDFSNSAFIDFKEAKAAYHELDDEEKAGEAFHHLLEAVAHLVKGPLHELPHWINPEYEMVEGFEFMLDEEFSILGLYSYLSSLEENHPVPKLAKDGSYRVEYKGEEYYITQPMGRAIVTQKGFTLGEILTSEDTKQWVDNLINEKGRRGGQFEYMMDNRTLATVLRKKGEELPYKKTERDAFLQRRAEHFQDMPAGVVLDIRFFLLSILSALLKREHTVSYSMHSRIRTRPRIVQPNQRKRKRGARRGGKRKRSGKG